MRLRKPGKNSENKSERSHAEWNPEPGIFQDSSLELMRGLDIAEVPMDEMPEIRWEPSD